MVEIRVKTNVGLIPNNVCRALVKSVRYEEPDWSTIGLERIFMETTDGLETPSNGWSISRCCFVHGEEFLQTKENILSGAITEGTEVTVEYNPNGIMCFYL